MQEFLASENLPVVDLAKICLTYLEFEAFDNPCSKEELEKRVRKYKLCSYAAQFWGLHIKGEAETLPCIQERFFRLLESDNKRMSILQIKSHAEEHGDYFTIGQTLLHVIADNGLTTLCNLYLDGRSKHRMYVVFVSHADQKCMGIITPNT